MLATNVQLSNSSLISSLAIPGQSVLNLYLQRRLQQENNPHLPHGGPVLPKASIAALWAYANRKVVNSYPLLYASLAMAHPN